MKSNKKVKGLGDQLPPLDKKELKGWLPILVKIIGRDIKKTK